VRLEGFDVQAARPFEQDLRARVDRPVLSMPPLVRSNPCMDVTRHVVRLIGSISLDHANTLAAMNDLPGGRACVAGALTEIAEMMPDDGTVRCPMVAEVVENLEQAMAHMVDRTVYMTQGAGYMHSAAQSHGRQRSNQGATYRSAYATPATTLAATRAITSTDETMMPPPLLARCAAAQMQFDAPPTQMAGAVPMPPPMPPPPVQMARAETLERSIVGSKRARE
jgi:hypothetical protein